MRYLRVLWMLPVLLLAQSAEAARISYATADCGTPPLGELQFTVSTDGTVTAISGGGTLSCPEPFGAFVPGALTDESGDPLYGPTINNVELSLTTTGIIPTFTVDGGLPASIIQGAGTLFVTFTTPVPATCFFGGIDVDSLVCPDLAIRIFPDGQFTQPITFAVTGVNVPEPTTLGLLGIGLAVATVRRRRTTVAKARTSRASSAPDTSHRT